MKKRFWKIEYSITIFVIFAIIMLLIPAQFMTSKEATYISRWNDIYNKMEYVFSAMSAQADANIIKGLNRAKTNEKREQYMMYLVKHYIRITDKDELKNNYKTFFLNGEKIKKGNDFYFEKLYVTENNVIVGIKDILDNDIYHPSFIMMFDTNGVNGPNTWGKDIFGINIFIDGKITPIGANWEISDLKKDCSKEGSGVTCSYYYRIGGDFIE